MPLRGIAKPASIVLEGFPGRAAVGVSGVIVGEVVAREGAIGALGFVEHRDVRLDRAIVHEPVQYLGRAIGAVADQALGIQVEVLQRALDHALCRQYFGLADRRRRRRSERTCGRCDRSTPAKVSLGQWATDRLFPTATKCESWTGDCTAITRQFASPRPAIEGSIWSRRGNRSPRGSPVQSRNTRSTRRRLNMTITVCESTDTGKREASRAACPALRPAST